MITLMSFPQGDILTHQTQANTMAHMETLHTRPLGTLDPYGMGLPEIQLWVADFRIEGVALFLFFLLLLFLCITTALLPMGRQCPSLKQASDDKLMADTWQRKLRIPTYLETPM